MTDIVMKPRTAASTDNFFQPLDGRCLLRKKGIFSEHLIYTYGGYIYAKVGNNYIKIGERSTSSYAYECVVMRAGIEVTTDATGMYRINT